MATPYGIGSDHHPGLSKIIEEAGETLQVLAKIQATGGERDYWDGIDLYDLLTEELGDLRAAVEFYIAHNPDKIDRTAIDTRTAAKLATYEEWHTNPAQHTPNSDS